MSFLSAEGSNFAVSPSNYPIEPYAVGYLITNAPANSAGIATAVPTTVYTSPVLPIGVYHIDVSISATATAGNTLQGLSINVNMGATPIVYALNNPKDDASPINLNVVGSASFISDGVNPITVVVLTSTSAGTWGIVGGGAGNSVITLVRVA